MVGTPHVLDHAVTASARQVAGPVEPRARFAEGVGQEALGGQAGPIVVGTGQPGTAGDISSPTAPTGSRPRCSSSTSNVRPGSAWPIGLALPTRAFSAEQSKTLDTTVASVGP